MLVSLNIIHFQTETVDDLAESAVDKSSLFESKQGEIIDISLSTQLVTSHTELMLTSDKNNQ